MSREARPNSICMRSHGMQIGAGAILLIALVCGCGSMSSRVDDRGSAIAPPPCFDRVNIKQVGGSYVIDVGGMEEYLSAYGHAGWIRGLSDTRPATAARRSGKYLSDPSDEYDSTLRVCDLFAIHYRELHGDDLAYAWPSRSTRAQRDMVIAVIVGELQPTPSAAPG